MKIKRIVALILCIVIAAGCVTTVSAVNPADYVLYNVFELKVGEAKQFTYKDTNNNLIKGWTSTNPKVVSITADGLATALSAGEAVMELSISGGKIGKKIKVTEPAYKLSKSKLSLYVGGKSTLKLNGAVGTVKWSSSNKKVATVSSKGVVTAKKAGKATVKAKIGSKNFRCAVTVKNKPVKLNQTKVTLNAGKKFKLKLTNAKGKVKWSSSKKKVAAVSSKGVVKAKKAGKAVISAKVGGKKYKCTFTVKKKNAVAKTIVGSKTMSYTKNTATISKVKTTLDPATLKKNAKLTLKTVSNLPKLNGAKLKAYDFSLSGAKVSSTDLAILEIPVTVKKGQQAVAGYYNEKKKKWQSVPCSYKSGKVSIIASHFSTYGAGAVSYNFFTYGDNTTMERVISHWAPSSASITGEEAMKVTSESLKKGTLADKCSQWGWQAFNNLFDNNVNWKANLFGALGISTKMTDFINDHTAAFGAVGFVLAYIDAIKYAWQGEHQQAAYTAYNGCSGAVTALLAQKIGTAAISAGCFAVTVISYAIIKTYSQALSDNEAKWYKFYKYYYNSINPRKPYQWKNLLLPILENKKATGEQIKKEVEAEVDKYVKAAWYSEEFDVYFYEATGISFSKGGLNQTIKDKLSAQYKHELMNGNIALVYKWYATKLEKDAQKELDKTTEKIAEEFNQEFEICFYDGKIKKGKTSKYAGYTVRFKNISSKLTDKKKLKLELNSKGKASTSYTLFAAVKYNIKPKVELVSPKGKVVKTLSYTIKSKTTKVNINPKAKSNTWTLNSSETYALKNGFDKPHEKLGSTYKYSPYSNTNITYNFTFGDDSITTKYTYTYTDPYNSANNKSENCAYKASFSSPNSTYTPGGKATFSRKITLLSRSQVYGNVISQGTSIEISPVNPTDKIDPDYPWVRNAQCSLGYYGIVASESSNKVGDTRSQSGELSVPKTRQDGSELQKGDVFYLSMISTNNGAVSSYITYKYVYQ